jgi:hypothetical protein
MYWYLENIKPRIQTSRTEDFKTHKSSTNPYLPTVVDLSVFLAVLSEMLSSYMYYDYEYLHLILVVYTDFKLTATI